MKYNTLPKKLKYTPGFNMNNYFSNDWLTIYVYFPNQVNISGSSSVANPSPDICGLLFYPATIAKLGSGYTCTFDATGLQLVNITLGVGSTIYIGDPLLFNKNTVYLYSNSSAVVNMFMTT